VFSLRTIAMGTRDFSSNPSKALRHAGDALAMVTKYNRPIALLVSIDDWNRLLGEVRETSLTRLTFECAMAPASGAHGRVDRVVARLARRRLRNQRGPLQLASRRTQITDVHVKLPL
jgi:hypothetical protein